MNRRERRSQKGRRREPWQASAEQRGLWPTVSGNAINGVGEDQTRRPSPIYWHAPDATPHGPLQRYFYGRTANLDPSLDEARRERQAALDEPLVPVAERPTEPLRGEALTAEVKRTAAASGADDVGITTMRSAYVFEGHEVPAYDVIVVLALAQDYAAMTTAPSVPALVEVTRQYARGNRAAKAVANGLRGLGFDARPYGGPMAGSLLLIPAAIDAGLGELGKHGSLIHRTLGSNFRLACVLTSAPLTLSAPDAFGAADFCASCRMCEDACPPEAIGPERQLVRGQLRWYVDFDRCLPYFNENLSCAICQAVCPFSRPGDGPRLVTKLAARRR